MPWPEKQRRAIYLDVTRRKGKRAADKLMHEAGYGSSKKRRAARRASRGTKT